MANGEDRSTTSAQPLADAIGSGFQSLIEGLRDDVREDIREVRADLRQFMVDHGNLHERELIERREAHAAFYDFIRKAELDNATKAGALGVFRFIIEKLSANATRLVALIVALASALLAVTGQIHFVVGR